MGMLLECTKDCNLYTLIPLAAATPNATKLLPHMRTQKLEF